MALYSTATLLCKHAVAHISNTNSTILPTVLLCVPCNFALYNEQTQATALYKNVQRCLDNHWPGAGTRAANRCRQATLGVARFENLMASMTEKLTCEPCEVQGASDKQVRFSDAPVVSLTPAEPLQDADTPPQANGSNSPPHVLLADHYENTPPSIRRPYTGPIAPTVLGFASNDRVYRFMSTMKINGRRDSILHPTGVPGTPGLSRTVEPYIERVKKYGEAGKGKPIYRSWAQQVCNASELVGFRGESS